MNTHRVIAGYSALVGHESIRNLLSIVKCDFVKEIIKVEESCAEFANLQIGKWKMEMFLIRSWLEIIAYNMESIETIWWWNNAFRVEKMVFVSMWLERLNYLSLSGSHNPEPLDLPSYIVVITEYIKKLRADGTFERLRKEQMDLFNANGYYQIYTSGLAGSPSAPAH